MVDVSSRELEVLKFWKKDKTFQKSLVGKKKSFVFYDGPPFATGLPHYGHLLASTIKDTIPRFWTMKGYKVERVWGWDCHGLPVENIAEKKLGFKSKKDIERYGVDKFCESCRKMVLGYANEWKNTIERLGRWVEFDKSYKTMDNKYMESVWWAFKEIWKKGLIYEGRKVLLYCPRCETPLANAEIAMDNSYKNIKEESVVVKFKIKNKDEFLLAWTTTPWTLVGNAALAVNPGAKYVKIKNKGEVYILATERLNELTGEYKILSEFKGSDLEDTEYEPLYNIPTEKRGYYVISGGDGVSTIDGTGIVHMAAYGEFDYEMIKKYDLPLIEHIGKEGKLNLGPRKWIGKWFKDVDKEVIEDLESRNLLYKKEKHLHSYPFCYRCNTPLFYALLPSWFIDIQKMKKLLLKNNEKINWFPHYLKEGRFRKNLESAPDWNISRNRYWASVIPIWKCDCGEIKVIGSVAELKKEAINLPPKLDLHKHMMDKVRLKCKCGKSMSRVSEVMDCWFESGSMPFAQVHYPMENKKWFENNFPGDFVSEYIAQTRTWFYYSLVVSSLVFGKPPFLNVLTTGNILAEDGEKMSKSKGNFPDPMKMIEKFGADALRFYFLDSPVMKSEDVRFSEKGVEEIYKKVLLLLYNVSNFYSMNSDIRSAKIVRSKNILDEWIISRLNELNRDVEKSLNEYDSVNATRHIRKFIEDLSTWYLRRSRDRFNSDEAGEAKKVLEIVLEKTCRVLAPVLPFSTESIYLKMYKRSVHLQSWPKVETNKINDKLNKEMDLARELVSLALKERDRNGISVRQPLLKISVYGIKLSNKLEKIILDELNIKKIVWKKEKTSEIKVELDTKITPELEAEGFAREIARRVQAERKNMGLKKENPIELYINADSEMAKKLKNQLEFIRERTNSKKIEFTDDKNGFAEFKIKNHEFGIKICRLN